MKLYKQYLLFTLQNALRFPRQAFKVLPGLSLLLIGALWTIFQICTVTPRFEGFQAGIIIVPIFLLSFFVGITNWQLLGKRAIISARAADANLLMPAPVTPFQLHNFMVLKNSLSLIGLVFIIIASYGNAIFRSLPYPVLTIPLFFCTLFSLYALSFIVYFCQTWQHKFATYLRYVILICESIFIISIVTMTATNGLDYAVTSSFVTLFPIIGWNIGLMVAIASADIIGALLFTSLLTAGIVATYYLAKSCSYNYYEEELMFVQKTEQLFKRAYANERIELKAKFVKSNRQLTGLGKNALLDIAWLREGKLWFLSPGLWGKTTVLIGAYILFTISTQNSAIPLPLKASIFIGALNYLRLFTTNVKNTALTNDTYVALMPIKPIYKLLYPLVVRFARSCIFTICITLSSLLINQMVLGDAQLLFSLFIFAITLTMEVLDLMRCYLFQPLLINRFVGNLIRQLVEIIFIGATAFIIGVPIYLFNFNIAIIISPLIALVLASLFLLFSLIVYDNVEKGQTNDANS